MAENAFLTSIETAGNLQNMQAQRLQMQIAQQQAAAKQQEAERAAAMQQQFAADIQAAYQAPDTIQALGKVMTMYPEMADNIKKGVDVYQGPERERNLATLARTAIAVDADNFDAAKAEIQQNMQPFMTMPEAIRKDKQLFKRAIITQIAALGKEGQDLLTSMGWTPKAQLEQQEFGLKKEQFQTEKQKLAFDQKLAMAELGLKERGIAVQEGQLAQSLMKAQNPELSAGLQKIVDDSVTASVSAAGTANQARALADKAKQLNWTGGSRTQFGEYLKSLAGWEDEQSRVITQIEGALSKEVISNLPPGPATDKDVALARKAVMKATANPQELAQALEAAARIQDKAAAVQQAKADFISENGGLGKAKRDIVLSDGLTIPAGTAYSDVLKSAAKNATVIWEQHPKLGRVTELDIEETMKKNRMSRQQVIDMLRKVQ